MTYPQSCNLLPQGPCQAWNSWQGQTVHRWKVDACTGERLPWGSELCLDRCGSRDFNPSGSFFKVPSWGLHLHTSNKFRPFVSQLKPHKSATWKKSAMAQINPPGSGWASVEGKRHTRAAFKCTACTELLLCLATAESAGWSVQISKQVGKILC